MSALANAVSLLRDADFRDYCLAAQAYVARTVLAEAPSVPECAARHALAVKVLSSPTYGLDRLVTVIATDPLIAAAGPTAASLSEEALISAVVKVWTPIAKLDTP